MRERTQGSLIPDTLKEMETDELFKEAQENLRIHGQEKLTAEERKRRRRALDKMNVPHFNQFLDERGVERILRSPCKILQLNVGLYCNQACSHCHVESSPLRTEMMDKAVVDRCLRLLDESPSVEVVDVTGGAPELSPNFRYLVTEVRKRGKQVIDRCNLTVLFEPGQEDLAQFLANNGVRIVASLPCYSAKNVDQQRGRGVFEKSIQALLDLNKLGYGKEGTGLQLDLVYNPNGAFLPPSQEVLQQQYKEELMVHFGIEFNGLFTITNMPIKRYADYLHREGKMESYMQLLVDSFNAAATQGLMCRDTISVGWDGRIYDCDFNQQLAIGVTSSRKTVFDLESLDDLTAARVAVDNHCFGCTAGAGSSCQGATT
eukprot:jgi/Chlat1/3144/Chrsp21S03375